MSLKKKLSLLTAISLLSASLLAGCSSSGGGGGEKTAEEVLANPNARKAIAGSIDKQGLCDVILNNGSTPTDIFTAEGLAINEGTDYTDALEGAGVAYNEEEAKAAWEKAKEEVGFETVTVDLLTFDHDSGKRTGEFLQGELQDNLEGLTVEVRNLPFEQKLEEETNGNFDLAYSGWGADYPDPLTFLKTMKTDAQFAKKVGYDSADFNSLVEEAINADSVADGYAKYAEAEKLMLDDAYIAPLFQKGGRVVEQDYVSDLIKYPWGADMSFKYTDVDKDEKVLNLAESSDIPTLDLSKATDTVSFKVINNTMEGLTRMDAEGAVENGVAESWEVSEDKLTWTFKLRDDSVWSNGDKVTAKDFEYSWKRTLDPATASEYTYIMEDIASYKAVDDTTFEVKLNRPVSYFAELMSFPVFFPQNQKVVEEQGDAYGTTLDSVVYNGPFTLTTWKMEDQYSMTKNADYWDADKVKLDTVNHKVVKESSAEVNLYEDGQIDRAKLDSEFVDKFADDPNFKEINEAATFILQINGGREVPAAE